MAKWNLIIYAPAYNVERSVYDLVSRMSKVSEELKKSEIVLHSFIVVDDGSTDGTRNVLRALHSRYPFLSIVEKKSNEGPTSALFDGMEEALNLVKTSLAPEKTILIRMDSDLEHQPEDIPRLIEPIISKGSRVSVGYIPFDHRTGIISKLFNNLIGNSESKKFLGVAIPQFCPGFNAIRGDVFEKLLPILKENGKKFREKYGEDMLTIDFVILFLARGLGEEIDVVRLSPIERKWIKKASLSKLSYYLDYHRKTVEFLKGISSQE